LPLVSADRLRDYERALEQYEIAAEGLPNDARLLNNIFAVYRRQGRWQSFISGQ